MNFLQVPKTWSQKSRRKQNFINEKERADNLSLNILDAPPSCDHSKINEEIFNLKKDKENLKNAMKQCMPCMKALLELY